MNNPPPNITPKISFEINAQFMIAVSYTVSTSSSLHSTPMTSKIGLTKAYTELKNYGMGSFTEKLKAFELKAAEKKYVRVCVW